MATPPQQPYSAAPAFGLALKLKVELERAEALLALATKYESGGDADVRQRCDDLRVRIAEIRADLLLHRDVNSARA